MIFSLKDISIIALQFLYAFGGLVIIGALAYKLLKNHTRINEKRLRFERDFDEELQSQYIEQESKRVSNPEPEVISPQVANFGQPPAVPTLRHQADQRSALGPNKHRFQQNQRKYHLATRLARQGLSIDDIRRRVLLPDCEIELITRISNKLSADRMQDHVAMMKAIESG